MSSATSSVYIGQAGWSVPTLLRPAFPPGRTLLARYGGSLAGVEINSSFYQSHRPATYEKWAASVPSGFRFAVKVPKLITHEARLRHTDYAVARFLSEATHLGEKLGPLLVQLPPSLSFATDVAARFYSDLRARFAGPIVCEPRHASWFTPDAAAVLSDYAVARVAADPAPCAGAEAPRAGGGLVYYRLHGSPRMYHSAYGPASLDRYALAVESATARGLVAWCIFDNTASGAALPNALQLARRLGRWQPPAASPRDFGLEALLAPGPAVESES